MGPDPANDRPRPDTPRSLLITGTDTGVGKTVVTAAIASLLVAAGQRVAVYKAAQTGVGEGQPDDLAFVQATVGETPLLRTACSYRLRAPLAPAVAARLEEVPIDRHEFVRAYHELALSADTVLVEGAGGLLVPLAADYAMADLARELALPLLVVARPGLGTLNHTALTVEVARRRGLEVLGLVISDFPAEPDLATRTNPPLLVELTAAPLLGALPHVSGLSTVEARPGALAAVARASLAPRLCGGGFNAESFLGNLASATVAPAAAEIADKDRSQ
ncbi:MAG: dethiobiotin synthase [Dehalococcoidia bacterium]